jgi:hypothetical protein
VENPDRDHPGWKQHEEEQRDRWLRLSPLERIQWLDEAKRFAALATSALQEARDVSRKNSRD